MDDPDPTAAPSLRQIDLAVMAAEALCESLERLRERNDGLWSHGLVGKTVEEASELIQATDAHLVLFAREFLAELHASAAMREQPHGAPGGG